MLLGQARRQEVYYLWRGHTDDPEDAHVLEAAVASEAEYLVTFNIKDLAAVGQFGIEVVTPGEFLRAIQ